MKLIRNILFFLLCLGLVLSGTACKREDAGAGDQPVATLDQFVANEPEEENISQNVTEQIEETFDVEEAEQEEPIESEPITEKSYVDVSITKVKYEENEILQRADLIIRGIVLRNNGYIMTNPDNTRTNSEGIYSPNAQITDYTVQILEIYKGSYSDSTIHVKTKNGFGFSPDLILYGEDETSILASPLERVDLEVGKECILILNHITGVFKEEQGYYPFGSSGYLLEDSTGTYVNNSAVNPISISSVNAAEEIAAALNNVTE
ncbi:MAG: hypothetical protein IJ043_00460 [Clostridia bacterium]|nr:hypothetical protein [Clostridia bacterium]